MAAQIPAVYEAANVYRAVIDHNGERLVARPLFEVMAPLEATDEPETTTFAARTRLAISASALGVQTVGVVAPIKNTGTAANPVIEIDAASGAGPGSMSAAQFSLVDGATSDPLANTLGQRGASGEFYGVFFAPQSTGLPTVGIYKAPTNSVIVSTMIGGNDAKVVESVASTLAFGDEDQATETWIRTKDTGAIKLRFGGFAQVTVTDDGVTYTTIAGATGRVMLLQGDAAACLNALSGPACLAVTGVNKLAANANSVDFFGGSAGDGVGVLAIANASVVPTIATTGGGRLYASGGALYWIGSAGTITPIAPA